ncbi:TetR/AcrR family transcriptional regulator [Phenylobacterium sp. 58.2.17]|uniref:TetR/AcrR family transcriptional regulator n=1 Tax=Phenylobacterium sp. 58.2.17 TaxID=2969306 RepID=UPI00226402F2|nr:TetR/AcrR family transcriptional regulator [Phenylobacterium sp. 58.2.17]MCX7587660.1 TetR/AcrR family transcriptional regulator [Phenylobacterium sp. 58.2.17]
MSDVRTYNSRLRQEQAGATRERILAAMADLLLTEGRIEQVTNRAVAAAAGVTEVTVYRHFPSRDVLLRGLWEWLNRRNGVTVGMPESADDIIAKLPALYATFDAAPAHIVASLTSQQGREMRESLNEPRRAAFLSAVVEAAPDLPAGEQEKAAAMLQLIYSAYGWVSLREQWGVTGERAADAATWAVQTLLDDLRRRGAAPIEPAERGATRSKP